MNTARRPLEVRSIGFAQTLVERTERVRQDAVLRWVFAAGAFLVGFVTRFLIHDHLPPGFPYITFFPVIIITTFVAGLLPGVVIAVLSGLSAWYFFISPFDSWALNGPAVLALAFFVLIVVVDVLLIHWMHVALVRLHGEEATSRRYAEERDLLFRELQHRVSNNLAVVSSLLNAQRRTLSDGEAAIALTQAAARINLVAKIQRELYDPARQTLKLDRYLEGLGPDLIEAMDAHHVTYRLDAEPVDIVSELSVPIGLIATELISNAIEHAFADGRAGTLRVTLKRMEGGKRVALEVGDDGPGWPKDFVPAEARSLGMRIVHSLAQQIDGQLTIANRDGAVSRLVFSPTAEARPAPVREHAEA